jgi:predicted restriction endonuclease
MAGLSKAEWEAIKGLYGNKCVICGKTEKSVGVLEKAHIKAASRGGSNVVPMCPTHHHMYDTGKLTDSQLKKIGLTRQQHEKLRPKGKRKRPWPYNLFPG